MHSDKDDNVDKTNLTPLLDREAKKCSTEDETLENVETKVSSSSRAEGQSSKSGGDAGTCPDTVNELSSGRLTSSPITIAPRNEDASSSSTLQTSPLGTRILITGSPVKKGLIYNFSDKLQQILFDLAVVHACNIDQNFLVDPNHEPPKNLIGVLNEKMNSLYWENLQMQLDEEPPVLQEALSLVSELKGCLHSILLPWHNRIRAEIDEVLDEELIRQQAEKGFIDFQKYATYIINLVSKLCAPARDEEVARLKSLNDIVPTFRGIFELLNHMKIDMINYNLLSVKSELLRNGRQCERDKFNKWLNLSGSNLPNTRQWLSRYSPVPRSQNKKLIIQKAFLDLLRSWPGSQLPEPLDFDAERLSQFSEQYFSLIYTVTTITVALGLLSGRVRTEVFRTSLKDNLLVLMKGVKNDQQVRRVHANIIEQIVKHVREAQTSSSAEVMFTDEDKIRLTGLIDDINPQHTVRVLITDRVDECLTEIWNSAENPISKSLQYMTDEIKGLAKSMSVVLNHLLAVYGDLLYALISFSD